MDIRDTIKATLPHYADVVMLQILQIQQMRLALTGDGHWADMHMMMSLNY